MKFLIPALFAAATLPAVAADVYNVEPSHTYPSFEADHMGISFWRGKFTKTSGTITLDRAAKTGTIDITIDANSVDFGHTTMNEHARGKNLFNTEQFPTARYVAKTIKYDGDKPVSAEGTFTLLGVSKPLTLTIEKFKCIAHPFFKREVCGANASATFSRADFGMTYGLPMFSPEVKLAIQVEALKAD